MEKKFLAQKQEIQIEIGIAIEIGLAQSFIAWVT